jgi:hypothetical protein
MGTTEVDLFRAAPVPSRGANGFDRPIFEAVQLESFERVQMHGLIALRRGLEAVNIQLAAPAAAVREARSSPKALRHWASGR